MNLILFAASLVTLVLCVALLFLVRRLGRSVQPGLEGEWLARLSAERYRPMERLLDPAEEAFLAARADAGMVRRFRAQRRRIFRRYLQSLDRDFGKICAAIRMVLAHSQQDRPELAMALVKQEAVFALALLAVRGRLLLHAAGIGTVDVRGLVTTMDAMRRELSQLVPVSVGAAA